MKSLRITLTLLSTIILVLTLGLTALFFVGKGSKAEKTVAISESVLLPESTSFAICPKLEASNQKLAVYLANTKGKTTGAYTSVTGTDKQDLTGVGIEVFQVNHGGIISAAPKSGRNTAIVGATWVENQEKNPGVYLSACKEPVPLARYLSSGTEVGKTHTLTLVNPFERPVKTTVTVWSERGKEKNQQFVNIPAKSEKSVVLDGFYPQRKRLLVQVEAGGKGVVSFLSETTSEGLKDLGSAQVRALESATKELVIPAVKLEKGSQIWIYNPSSSPVKYRVKLYGAKQSSELQEGKEFKVLGQAIFSLPLDGYAGTQVAIGISAEKPVQASVYRPYNFKEGQASYLIDGAVKQDQKGVLFAAKETKVQLSAIAMRDSKLTLKSVSDAGAKKINIDLPANRLVLQKLPEGVWEWQASQPVTLTADYQIGDRELGLHLPSFPMISDNSEIQVLTEP